MRLLKWLSDWGFNYIMAWWVIILSPLWLPIWLAIKLNKWAKEEGNETLSTHNQY